jgi:glucose-6-phosphate isomerase
MTIPHDVVALDRTLFSKELNLQADALSSLARASFESLRTGNCPGREFTGWFDWPMTHGFALEQEIQTWAKSYKPNYDLVVVVGIGGSYLGAKSISDILLGPGDSVLNRSGKKIVFAGQNMSESALGDLLKLMELKSPVINVISKSGTTTEPGVAFRILKSAMERRYGKEVAAERIIATTDASKGALRKLAQESGFKTFIVPENVGGRYSVLTAVGLVPLALGGIDTKALLDGAHAAFEGFKKPELSGTAKVALEYAQCRTAAWNAGKVNEVITYPEPRMRNLVEWLKQLYGESDGKNGKGLLPVSLECTMDLHSLGQYLQEGPRSMMETFLAVENPRNSRERILVPELNHNTDELKYLENMGLDQINDAAMKATRVAHAKGGVPCLEIRTKDLSPASLGSLIAMYETSCAVGGLMLGVNPFDQPGVEAYKTSLFSLLGKPGY